MELPGSGHRVHAFDVADETAWSTVEVNELQGLVCAAAILGPIGSIERVDMREFRRTIEVNLLGTIMAVRHCLTPLKRGAGSIVMFGGGGATRPLPRFDAYATSKAAVARLTENLARDLAPIAVNCVAPGFVATDMHKGTIDAGPDAAGAAYFERTKHELARGGAPPEEAAALVLSLLEDVPFTGRLISAVWDPWRDPAFRDRLAETPELGTIRRIGGDHIGPRNPPR